MIYYPSPRCGGSLHRSFFCRLSAQSVFGLPRQGREANDSKPPNLRWLRWKWLGTTISQVGTEAAISHNQKWWTYTATLDQWSRSQNTYRSQLEYHPSRTGVFGFCRRHRIKCTWLKHTKTDTLQCFAQNILAVRTLYYRISPCSSYSKPEQVALPTMRACTKHHQTISNSTATCQIASVVPYCVCVYVLKHKQNEAPFCKSWDLELPPE